MLAVGSLPGLGFWGLYWCLSLFRFADLGGLFCIWFVVSFRGWLLLLLILLVCDLVCTVWFGVLFDGGLMLAFAFWCLPIWSTSWWRFVLVCACLRGLLA